MRTMNEAIHRIESFRPNFDYDEASTYAALVRRFYAGMKTHLTEAGKPLETPLVDSVSNQDVLLPAAVMERLESAVSAHVDYGRTVRNVCLWHLREALAVELGSTERHESLYQPLIQVLDKGGHFYEHHGALALGDAAMIPFVGR
ncbi:MAG: hypothetical protein AAGJ46_11065 [Planctomycetota bacterium]